MVIIRIILSKYQISNTSVQSISHSQPIRIRDSYQIILQISSAYFACKALFKTILSFVELSYRETKEIELVTNPTSSIFKLPIMLHKFVLPDTKINISFSLYPLISTILIRIRRSLTSYN